GKAIATVPIMGGSESKADAEAARRSAPPLITPEALRRGGKRRHREEARHERRNGKSSSHLHLLDGVRGGRRRTSSDPAAPGVADARAYGSANGGTAAVAREHAWTRTHGRRRALHDNNATARPRFRAMHGART